MTERKTVGIAEHVSVALVTVGAQAVDIFVDTLGMAGGQRRRGGG